MQQLLQDEFDDDSLLYHGTSLSQYEEIKRCNWRAYNLHLSDDLYLSEWYAEEKGLAENTTSIMLVFDALQLEQAGELEDNNPEDELHDLIGNYYIFNGCLKNAIVDCYDLHTGESIDMLEVYEDENLFYRGIW